MVESVLILSLTFSCYRPRLVPCATPHVPTKRKCQNSRCRYPAAAAAEHNCATGWAWMKIIASSQGTVTLHVSSDDVAPANGLLQRDLVQFIGDAFQFGVRPNVPPGAASDVSRADIPMGKIDHFGKRVRHSPTRGVPEWRFSNCELHRHRRDNSRRLYQQIGKWPALPISGQTTTEKLSEWNDCRI